MRDYTDEVRAFSLALMLFVCAGTAAARVNFIRDVKPILESRCVRCHGASGAAKGLRLDHKLRAMMAIVPKKPDESRIVAAVESGFMPPGAAKLSPAEIATLRKWIAEGARWPKNVELEGKIPAAP